MAGLQVDRPSSTPGAFTQTQRRNNTYDQNQPTTSETNSYDANGNTRAVIYTSPLMPKGDSPPHASEALTSLAQQGTVSAEEGGLSTIAVCGWSEQINFRSLRTHLNTSMLTPCLIAWRISRRMPSCSSCSTTNQTRRRAGSPSVNRFTKLTATYGRVTPSLTSSKMTIIRSQIYEHQHSASTPRNERNNVPTIRDTQNR